MQDETDSIAETDSDRADVKTRSDMDTGDQVLTSSSGMSSMSAINLTSSRPNSTPTSAHNDVEHDVSTAIFP